MLVLMLRCWRRWSSILLLRGSTTLSKVLALHRLLLVLVLLLLLLLTRVGGVSMNRLRKLHWRLLHRRLHRRHLILHVWMSWRWPSRVNASLLMHLHMWRQGHGVTTLHRQLLTLGVLLALLLLKMLSRLMSNVLSWLRHVLRLWKSMMLLLLHR
jgi:hypothetical protein